MRSERLALHPIARAAAACVLGFSASFALAAQPAATPPPAAPSALAAPPAASGAANRASSRAKDHADELAAAKSQVKDTVAMVQTMESDPQLKTLMQKAKGIFFIPDYGRASLIVGGQGGAGVLMVRHGGEWTGPGFYTYGGASIGAQAGVAGGSIAMLLMDDKAVRSFRQHDKFSLNADAGLTVVDYSTRAHGATSHGDVIVWADTKGLQGNLSVSVTDVNYNGDQTQAYYGKSVTAQQVASGQVQSTKAEALTEALPG